MNYLAHAYLSFEQPEILTGNMISDFVKGKKQFAYPVNIQKGIRLHRAIDAFTDTHPVTRAAKKILEPAAGRYAPAFVDVVYDHFLANDPAIFTETSLVEFARVTYRQLQSQQEYFPEKFAYLFPYMQSQDWLSGYRFNEGIEKSFGGVARRALYLAESPSVVFQRFLKDYALLKDAYASFFSELHVFAREQFNHLLNV
jgi:acyl carrier protein phosphodiesterase